MDASLNVVRVLLALLLSFLLAVPAWASGGSGDPYCPLNYTHDGPSPVGGGFADQATAAAACNSQVGTYLAQQGDGYTTVATYGQCTKDPLGNRIQIFYLSSEHNGYTPPSGCGDVVNTSNPPGADAQFTWNGPVCNGPVQNTDEWSSLNSLGSDIPPGGTIQCGSDHCAVVWQPTDPLPHFVAAFQRYTQPGTLTQNGNQCSASPSTPAPPDATPPQVAPPTNTNDPPPPDGAPPPPPTPPPVTPPPPDTGSPSAATGADISALANMLAAQLGVTNTELQMISQDLAAINQSVNAADTNITGAVKGVAGGVSGGTGTDMGPTNALLTSIKSNTAPDTSTGGSTADCSVPPTATGQSTTQFQIAMNTWRSACQAASQLADSGNGLHGGLSDSGTNDGFIQPSSASSDGGDGYDQSGFGWGTSCPASPHFTVFGRDITFDTTNLCTSMTITGALVVLLAGLVCLRITAGAIG